MNTLFERNMEQGDMFTPDFDSRPVVTDWIFLEERPYGPNMHEMRYQVKWGDNASEDDIILQVTLTIRNPNELTNCILHFYYWSANPQCACNEVEYDEDCDECVTFSLELDENVTFNPAYFFHDSDELKDEITWQFGFSPDLVDDFMARIQKILKEKTRYGRNLTS